RQRRDRRRQREQQPRRSRDRNGLGDGMSDVRFLSGKTAIAGIGATDFSKDSGRSELKLAVQAIEAACQDAGISPTEIDGLVTFTMDTNPQIAVARELGISELNV